ncbi:MerR family transcriptional regulator [Isoptericola dokdonensis]|uniref:HTH merR-type domain-containing protein n=1 Tax=Isoptericola dokdonensis DS-3 TaxID=1300344 RepID=A0A161HQI3_9MICO|nr:MerR family transcriptional regulator [Isoptericola dokdonensis]ANC31452.1 hypothetical protein I598_1904 [Isoptericola dokdonensis DS-3]
MQQDIPVDTNAAATAVGVAPRTIRSWANRGHLTAQGRDRRGRKLYALDDVRRVAMGDRPANRRNR